MAHYTELVFFLQQTRPNFVKSDWESSVGMKRVASDDGE
jgi:hypothetical protein